MTAMPTMKTSTESTLAESSIVEATMRAPAELLPILKTRKTRTCGGHRIGSGWARGHRARSPHGSGRRRAGEEDDGTAIGGQRHSPVE